MRSSKRRKVLLFLLIFVISLTSAFALWSGIIWPEASGRDVSSNDALTVDYSHASDGYIMCKGKPSNSRYKMRIEKDGQTFTYDLNTDGFYETFPLQLGSGKYKVSLYKNKSGKKYSSGGEVKISASMNNEYAAFLIPTQYVDYTSSSGVVAMSDELCAGLSSDREKFEKIRSWIKATFLYDYVKAATVASGTLPDIDGTLENRMGICQDLAAIAACMLRVQGIPTQMAIGYRNNEYHAWNYVYLDGQFQLYDPTMEVNDVTKEGKYTLERYY